MNIKNIFFILPLTIFISCGNQESNTEALAEETDLINVEQESIDSLPVETPALTEWEIKDSLEIQKVIDYYNHYLSVVYAERDLLLVRSKETIQYKSTDEVDLAENFEGGGVQRTYLKIMENGTDWVGLIGYGLYDEIFETSCFALLPKGNLISTIQIVPADWDGVLQVYSTKSNQQSKVPYDLAVYHFGSFLGRTYPLLQTQANEIRFLKKDEIIKIKEIQKIAVPRGNYEGNICETVKLENAMPGASNLQFGANGNLGIGQFAGFSSKNYYKIAQPGKISIFNLNYSVAGPDEDINETFKYKPATINYSISQPSKEIQSITFEEAYGDILSAGSACQEI